MQPHVQNPTPSTNVRNPTPATNGHNPTPATNVEAINNEIQNIGQ